MPSAARIHLSSDRLAADGNILPGHPAERASWIWAEGRGPHATALLRFTLDFEEESDGGEPLLLHVTADQRHRLFLDDELVSAGPDRGDLEHWPVATLALPVTRGPHRLTALVWYLAEDLFASRMAPTQAGRAPAPNPPMAQISYRAGFLCCGAAGTAPERFDTGAADWRVCDLTAAMTLRAPVRLGYHDIGPEFAFDLAQWRTAETVKTPATVVRRPPVFNVHGVRSPGWVLASTPLPEQRRDSFSGGVIRAARPWRAEETIWTETPRLTTAVWQTLLANGEPVRVSAGEAVELLWDFQSYVCGYPELAWSGGAEARVEFAWAEALYEGTPGATVTADSPKGHRAEIEGRTWLGFGDAFVASGAAEETAPALWWRSGRFARLRVRTAKTPLVITRLGICRTGYPLARDWRWRSSDAAWDEVMPLLSAGLEACAHETWVDCPYYEQMMYVGDTRLHALSNYAGWRDDRLSRRALELFDWSRSGSLGGLVAERYPCAWRQESTTYALIWVWMVRDFLLWRDDAPFVRRLVPGVRQLLEAVLSLRGADGLLKRVPGWPFVDWVPAWNQGCGPGVREGDSSLVNLHLVLALQAAAEIEASVGEAVLAERCTALAAGLFERVLARYWSETSGCLRDTVADAPLSEHAQVLALLTGLLPAEKAAQCRAVLLSGGVEAKCSIYFSFYLLEVLAQAGEADAFFEKLQFWRGLPRQGFVSLPEQPEPARSDCHGWGAHPLYHSLATIAGVRPSAPGMARVRIAPLPGSLSSFDATVVHPGGEVTVRFSRNSMTEHFEVGLPPGVDGVLCWREAKHALRPGRNTLALPVTRSP